MLLLIPTFLFLAGAVASKEDSDEVFTYIELDDICENNESVIPTYRCEKCDGTGGPPGYLWGTWECATCSGNGDVKDVSVKFIQNAHPDHNDIRCLVRYRNDEGKYQVTQLYKLSSTAFLKYCWKCNGWGSIGYENSACSCPGLDPEADSQVLGCPPDRRCELCTCPRCKGEGETLTLPGLAPGWEKDPSHNSIGRAVPINKGITLYYEGTKFRISCDEESFEALESSLEELHPRT